MVRVTTHWATMHAVTQFISFLLRQLRDQLIGDDSVALHRQQLVENIRLLPRKLNPALYAEGVWESEDMTVLRAGAIAHCVGGAILLKKSSASHTGSGFPRMISAAASSMVGSTSPLSRWVVCRSFGIEFRYRREDPRGSPPSPERLLRACAVKSTCGRVRRRR
jgi:hypothetical protein